MVETVSESVVAVEEVVVMSVPVVVVVPVVSSGRTSAGSFELAEGFTPVRKAPITTSVSLSR